MKTEALGERLGVPQSISVYDEAGQIGTIAASTYAKMRPMQGFLRHFWQSSLALER